jgi:hypothetical protein
LLAGEIGLCLCHEFFPVLEHFPCHLEGRLSGGAKQLGYTL